MMKKILAQIRMLRNSSVKNQIDSRLKELKENQKNPFKELSFCILTANFNAKGGIKIQEAIDNGFLTMTETELAKKLKELGHRFPNTRAEYIVEARKYKESLETAIKHKSQLELREWIAENVRGLGYKEASHFLRNIGLNDAAIIDFHIVDLLVKHNLIEAPKNLNKKRYLEIEDKLREIANTAKMSLGELDFYLWYMETGAILK